MMTTKSLRFPDGSYTDVPESVAKLIASNNISGIEIEPSLEELSEYFSPKFVQAVKADRENDIAFVIETDEDMDDFFRRLEEEIGKS
jgi:hypothetical protein